MAGSAELSREAKDILSALLGVAQDHAARFDHGPYFTREDAEEAEEIAGLSCEDRVRVGEGDTFREIRLDQLFREAEALLK